jgi:hypothetical protein
MCYSFMHTILVEPQTARLHLTSFLGEQDYFGHPLAYLPVSRNSFIDFEVTRLFKPRELQIKTCLKNLQKNKALNFG